MSDRNPYLTKEYAEGYASAQWVIATNSDANRVGNPYDEKMKPVEWRNWNRGWNSGLRTEQP